MQPMPQPVQGKINAASRKRMDHVVLVLAVCIWLSYGYVPAKCLSISQESPVIVAVGYVAIFTCNTSTPVELTEARWFRTQNGRHFYINIFQDGRDQQMSELPEYFGRTDVIKDGLTNGRAALKLFNVSAADEGAYRCYLYQDKDFDFEDLKLNVTALGSEPRIDIEGFEDGGIKAVCRSAEWYPQPTLVNKDDDGKLKIYKEENGLYSIQYSRIITANSNRIFSCKLRTPYPHHERGASVYVTDDMFPKGTHYLLIIIIAVILCAVQSVPTYLNLYFYTRQPYKPAIAVCWGCSASAPVGSEGEKAVSTSGSDKAPSPSVPPEQAFSIVCPDPKLHI